MKKVLLALSCLFLYANSYSQWSKVNVGTNEELYCIDYYSSSDIWIGSGNELIKSTNGGASWLVNSSLTDNSNLPITSAFFSDIALFSSSTAIGTGLIAFGSDEYILNTTNGGANWAYANSTPTFSPPQYYNALDANGTNAVAVGTTGLISTSTNSGASWGAAGSPTTNYLSDVKYFSHDTLFAVGQYTILKSVNGGSSWSTYTTTATCQFVSGFHKTVYVGTQDGTFLLKSTDYGATFSSVPLPFSSTGVILAISQDTLLCGGTTGLYISKNGGSTWEEFLLSGYQQLDMIDRNGSSIMAVGQGGYAIRTSNLNACPTIPIASFNIQGGASSFCLNDVITLNNTTAQFPGYTYKWLINNVPFDNNYNSHVQLLVEGNETVSLVVSNAYGSDTVKTTVFVVGHSINPMVVTSSLDSICSGNMVSFSIANTQNGVSYQLRNGFTKIGSVQSGNGGTLTFSDPTPNPTTTTFNVIAVKTTSCFTDSIIATKTVSLYSNPTVLTPASCSPAPNLCNNHGITNVTLGNINHTTDIFINNYFDYSCCQKTDLTIGTPYPISVSTSNFAEQYVVVWIDLNNDGVFAGSEQVLSGTTTNFVLSGTLNIPASTTAFNQYLRMRVESNWEAITSSCAYSTDCGQTEDYAVRILNAPTKPIPSFTSVATVACATNIAFSSTSYNATSYLWNFGDGSAPVGGMTPTHTYTVSGNYTVYLKTCNAYGCDSVSHVVSITIPLVPKPAGCTINMQSGYSGLLGRFTFDTLLVEPHPTGGSYADYTCTKQFRIHAGSSYTLTIESSSGFACATFGCWIDFNNDGLFTANEEINAQANTYTACPSISGPIVIQIPTNAVQATALRMRLMFYDNSGGYITDGCNSGSVIRGGQALDYTVFVDPPLPVVPSFHANYIAACTNTNITFTNTSSNATIYSWNFGDGTTSNVQSPTHIYANAGTYSVKLVESNGTYSDSITRANYITVQTALPVPVITLAGQVLSTNAVAAHYQWYKNGTAITNDTTTSINVGLNTGTYKVVVTNSNGCTTASADYSYHPIHSSFTCSPTAICGPNTNYTLLTNGSQNATSYTINWGDGTAPYTYNGSGGPIHTYTTVGLFTISMIACNGVNCDTMIRTNYITVSSGPPTTPVITWNGSQLTTTNVSMTYQWYFNNTIITGATSPSYTPTADGSYKLSVDNAGCSAASATFSYLHTHVAFHANTATFCGASSQTVGFTNTTTGATSYTWSFGDGQTSTAASPTHTYSGYGYYTVKLKACGTLNCDSMTIVNCISIHPAAATPVLTLNGNVLSTTSIDSTYQWNFNNVAIPGATSSSYAPTQDGFYSLKVTNMGCSATTLNYHYTPVHVNFSVDTTNFCGSATHTVTITNTTVNGTSYVWTFGDGQTSTSTSIPFTHTYTGYGTYTMKLKACGNINCDSITRTAYITISPPVIITANPSNSTICSGGNTSFSVMATGSNLTYQWQVSTDGGTTYSNLSNSAPYSNVTTAALNLTAINPALNGAKYKCLVNGGCVQGISTTGATLTITGAGITTNPVSTGTCSGSNASFTVGASGTGLAYQWMVSTDGGNTYNNLSNTGFYSNSSTTTLNLTGVTAAVNGAMYACSVSGSCGPAAISTGAMLTVKQPTAGDTTASACSSFSWYGTSYTSSGTATHHLTNKAGCDSTLTLHLIIKQPSTGDTTASTCSSFTWYGNVYAASGTPIHHFTNKAGCDSTVTLHLTIGQPTNGDTTATACTSFTWYGTKYTTNGTPVHHLANKAGCDSAVTLHLTIHSLPIRTTTINAGTITADQSGASYHWLDCNSHFTPLTGYTGQSFIAPANGNYAVAIGLNGCSDTSACVNITITGIADTPGAEPALRIFPNPNSGTFTVQSVTEGVYQIANELGQVVRSFKLNAGNNYTINIQNLSNGVYFIVGNSDKQLIRQRIVVTK